METFLPSFYKGIWHVANWPAIALLLFVIAVAVVCTFKDWKALLYISLVFTLGFILGYFATHFSVLDEEKRVVNLAQMALILVFAVFNFTSTGKNIRSNFRFYLAILLGLCSGYMLDKTLFTELFSGTNWLDFSLFALGIEAAVILGFVGVLVLSWLFANALKIPKKDFSLILSGAVMGISALKLLEAIF